MLMEMDKGINILSNLPCSSCSDVVEVKLWLPEMNGVNVTICCDRLVKDNNGDGSLIALVTDLGCINCLSVLNIEQQSSGFKIGRQIDVDDKSILFMEVSSDRIKSELTIPDDYTTGFVWGKKLNNLNVQTHGVSTSKYESRYILNFSVSGEFNLDICYVSEKETEPIWIFSKSFCCK